MNMMYRQEIVNLNAFRAAANTLLEKDRDIAESLIMSVTAIVKDRHLVLADNTSSEVNCRIALLEEYIAVREYLQLHVETLKRLETQWRQVDAFTVNLSQDMCDKILDDILSHFEATEKIMLEEIDNQSAWDTGIKDLVNKSAGTILSRVGANKKIGLEDKTLVEKVIAKHLDPKRLSHAIENIIQENVAQFNSEWKRMAETAVAIRSITEVQIDLRNMADTGRIDSTGQVLGTGIGSSVIGVMGVAAGWHTLSYAMTTVFPPLILFSAIATAMVGVATKDKSTFERKKQIRQIVEYYNHYFHFYLNAQPIEELENRTFKEHLRISGELLCTQLKTAQERRLLGNLTSADFQLWLDACNKHLELLRCALQK